MRKSNYNTSRKISTLISAPESALGQLTQRSEQLARLQSLITQRLDASCQAHCWLAGYQNGKLLLQSDSSVWATRIRLQQAQLTRELSGISEFSGIRSVAVAVRPRYEKTPPKQIAQPLSSEAGRVLVECARDTSDLPLKAALLKLAQHGQQVK